MANQGQQGGQGGQGQSGGQGGGEGRGFAGMDKDKQREIAAEGGRSVPDDKRSFSQDPELAAEAGRKGGEASGGNTQGGNNQGGGNQGGGNQGARGEGGEGGSSNN